MVSRYETPAKPGHYWAKLVLPSNMPEGEDWKSVNWEVVQVFENCVDRNHPEHLGVFVPGVGPTQWIDDFIWGPRVADFHDERAEPGLTEAEKKAQGARCGCRGADDMCVCQNVTDATTRADRAQRGRR